MKAHMILLALGLARRLVALDAVFLANFLYVAVGLVA